jgi:peroxiredoxin
MRATGFFLSTTLLFFFISAPTIQASDSTPALGNPAPAFELKSLDGRTVRLSDLQGRVVLLNFWSTRCAPCTAEMPSLNRLYASLRKSGLNVCAISIDASDRPVRELIQEKGITFTILMDSEKETYFDSYTAPSLPMTYLIDAGGVIRQIFSGPQEWDSSAVKEKIVQYLPKKQ